MREIVSIHIGQAGVQLGNACWELFCLEHSIDEHGQMALDKKQDLNDDSFSALFSETSKESFVPRSIFVDLEPNVIDEVRVSSYKDLYSEENLISGKEDASNIYSRGYYTVGKSIVGICIDKIRKITENCTDLQGFMIFNSIGGGTGSGFGSLLLEHLSREYENKTKLGFCIYPSPELSSSVVEPYNNVLAIHKQLEYLDIGVVFDNQANYENMKRCLGMERPSFSNINQLIAQLTSSITSPLRFESSLNMDLADFKMNLVPYPQIKFMISSYAPIMNREQAIHEQLSVKQISLAVFNSQNFMVKVNPDYGKFYACSMIYKGDVPPFEVYNAVTHLKKKRTIQFIDWCPTGFKVGINQQPPTYVPGGDLAKVRRSCCLISNTSAISEVFSRIDKRFDVLFSKRSFVHWFIGEGMEEWEFQEAREDLAAQETYYEEPNYNYDFDEDENQVVDDDENYG